MKVPVPGIATRVLQSARRKNVDEIDRVNREINRLQADHERRIGDLKTEREIYTADMAGFDAALALLAAQEAADTAQEEVGRG